MSKLSPSLKALISASHAKPGPIPAPSNIRSVYEGIAKSAASKNVGTPAWLSVAVCVNSPLRIRSIFPKRIESISLTNSTMFRPQQP